jgi:hypothetical protein
VSRTDLLGALWNLKILHWKARIVLILEELELWDIVENSVVPPTDAVLLAEFMKRNIKAKKTILDAVLV